MHVIDRASELLTGRRDRGELANLVFIGVAVFFASWVISGFGAMEAGSAFLGAVAGVAIVAVIYRLRRRRAQGRREHEEA